MRNLVIYIIILLLPCLLYADRTNVISYKDPTNPCQTDFDPNSTLITFYGDSLGELIRLPLYGYFGWEWYLTTQEPRVRWDVQNFAVTASTTRSVWDLITECSKNKTNRNNYRTADNIAMEIGGNDYVYNLAILYYMPWKFADVDRTVTHNTRVIVRALRNELRNKRILVMGNFPVISKSPILGEGGDYFVPLKYLPNGQITTKNSEYKESLLQKEFSEDMADAFEVLILGIGDIYNSIVNILSPILGSGNTDSLFTNGSGQKSPTGKDLWYWNHLREWQASPFSLISIGLQFHQSSLAKMVEEENNTEHVYVYKKTGYTDASVYYPTGRVNWVPLYADFSYPPDAQFGRYFVANPVLFSDPIHLNHIGYYKWVSLLTPKLKSLGWHSLPEPTLYNGVSCKTFNCGAVKDPPNNIEVIVEELQPEPVQVTPNNIDWMVLICLFTGKCW